jgi:hypothetical protein
VAEGEDLEIALVIRCLEQDGQAALVADVPALFLRTSASIYRDRSKIRRTFGREA